MIEYIKGLVASWDKNVYFISSKKLMKLARNDGTVDNCHPNDFGFFSMAQAIGDVIEIIRQKWNAVEKETRQIINKKKQEI